MLALQKWLCHVINDLLTELLRSVLEIRSPHSYTRPSKARAVWKRSSFVFANADRVTRLVNRKYFVPKALQNLKQTKSTVFFMDNKSHTLENRHYTPIFHVTWFVYRTFMAMFTLYRIGFCSVVKVAPVQCEQELIFCCGAEIVPKAFPVWTEALSVMQFATLPFDLKRLFTKTRFRRNFCSDNSV